MFLEGDCHCPPLKYEVARVVGGVELESAVTAGQAGRSPTAAGQGLRLVHRWGLHVGRAGDLGLARRVGIGEPHSLGLVTTYSSLLPLARSVIWSTTLAAEGLSLHHAAPHTLAD
jgi:hypothetical protein